jgi:hypothetical protein
VAPQRHDEAISYYNRKFSEILVPCRCCFFKRSHDGGGEYTKACKEPMPIIRILVLFAVSETFLFTKP